MGIMTRLFHRSNGLSENPFKYFFLDMGENIHIHYRDLRIELSVPEFLEFAEAFDRCAPSVKQKIADGYKDGVLPNTNESGTLTTISLDSPLKHNVKYNSNRISLEENTDGFHLHFRNYKLLFNKTSFDNILSAMNDVVVRRNSSRTLDEVLSLIAHNDLEYQLIEINRGSSPPVALVEVAQKYSGKVKQIFKGLGFKLTGTSTELHYKDQFMEIRVQIGNGKRRNHTEIKPSPFILLVDYLASRRNEITARELNLIKLQVLNAFGLARSGDNPYINLDFRSFLFDPINQQVQFLNSASRHSNDISQAYQKYSSFLHELSLFFVKPEKNKFSDIDCKSIYDIFTRHVCETIGSQPCVNKIYVLGSSTQNNLGQYDVPFIHFDWAKLASDFDILIEIDEAHDVPDSWQKKFFTDYSGCYYYHLGDVPHHINSPYPERFPHVTYFNHLIEAYLFFPSTCKSDVKEKYLSNLKAELIYSASDNTIKKKLPVTTGQVT